MEIGVDSFAAMFSANRTKAINDVDAMAQLLHRIVYADKMGIDVFGIGYIIPRGFSIPRQPIFWLRPLHLQNRFGLQVQLWC